jgi:thioredoxin reductase (NADPH)
MRSVSLAIIGSGPAGLTAAIYSARADLKPVVFEGMEPGGQLTSTTLVENFPGFEEGILGPELMEIMRKQAQRFGAEIITEEVTSVKFDQRPFVIRYGENDELHAEVVIIATGASAKWIGLPSEQDLRGFGVSSCATCDGFFFRGKKVAVVGGGDTAMEDALHLTRFATEVVVIHRRAELRASKIMKDRAASNPKIKFQWNSVVEEVLGLKASGVSGLILKNVKTNEKMEMKIDGLFVAIGHNPNTKFLNGQLTLDANGFVSIQKKNVYTSVPGVFAAGDVVDPRYRQAITAAGLGCMAALEAQEFLDAHPLK